MVTIEWTNQHGCGGSEDKDPHKLNCNIVLQYMCEPDVNKPDKYNIRNGKLLLHNVLYITFSSVIKMRGRTNSIFPPP